MVFCITSPVPVNSLFYKAFREIEINTQNISVTTVMTRETPSTVSNREPSLYWNWLNNVWYDIYSSHYPWDVNPLNVSHVISLHVVGLIQLVCTMQMGTLLNLIHSNRASTKFRWKNGGYDGIAPVLLPVCASFSFFCPSEIQMFEKGTSDDLLVGHYVIR